MGNKLEKLINVSLNSCGEEHAKELGACGKWKNIFFFFFNAWDPQSHVYKGSLQHGKPHGHEPWNYS
jgi:hypothetical protein